MGGGAAPLRRSECYLVSWIVAKNLLLKKNTWMKIQKLHKFA